MNRAVELDLIEQKPQKLSGCKNFELYSRSVDANWWCLDMLIKYSAKENTFVKVNFLFLQVL